MTLRSTARWTVGEYLNFILDTQKSLVSHFKYTNVQRRIELLNLPPNKPKVEEFL